MITEHKILSDHFNVRLSQRFGLTKAGIVDRSFQLITRFSPNRYAHPNVMEYLKRYKTCKYLVDVKENMIIPTTADGYMITALYYRRPLKLVHR